MISVTSLALPALAWILAIYTSIASGNNRYLSVDPDGSSFVLNNEKVFLSGLNQPWIDYGYDFGSTLEIDEKNDKMCQFNCTLRSIADNNGNSVRIWLHAGGDSTPVFDKNGYVTRTDYFDELIDDMKQYLEIAKQHNILVFFVLWNGAIKFNKNLNGLMTNSRKLESYIENCLNVMVEELSNEAALGGWEIINEPEMSVEIATSNDGCTNMESNTLQNAGINHANNSVPLSTMQYFINRQSAAIHEINPNALVTIGVWSELTGTDMFGLTNFFKDECLIKSGNNKYSNGILDFYQWHCFSNHNNDFEYNKHAPFHGSQGVNKSEYNLTKPLVIGEFSYINSDHSRSVDDMYIMLYENGYGGAWDWSSDASITASDGLDIGLQGIMALSEVADMKIDINNNNSNNSDFDFGFVCRNCSFAFETESDVMHGRDRDQLGEIEGLFVTFWSVKDWLDHFSRHICLVEMVFSLLLLYIWVAISRLCYKHKVNNGTNLHKSMGFVGFIQIILLVVAIPLYLIGNASYYQWDFSNLSSHHVGYYTFILVCDIMVLIPLYNAALHISALLFPPGLVAGCTNIATFFKNAWNLCTGARARARVSYSQTENNTLDETDEMDEADEQTRCTSDTCTSTYGSDLIGLGCNGTLSKSKCKNQNSSLGNLVIFRWITRGLSPELIKTNLAINWEILKDYQDSIKIELVTDNIMEDFSHACDACGIPCKLYDQVVVPKSFESVNNTKFKARGLYYSSKHSIFGNDVKNRNCYIFHCDEESIVTRTLMEGIKSFISKYNGTNTTGQGLCVFRNDELSVGSYLCHMADSARMTDDLGRMRLQLFWLNGVYFGFKGSFVLCPNSIEVNESTSYDICGEYGSITEDAWWALAQPSDNKFAWCDGILIEQSPFTVTDLIKQRKRWNSGLFLLLYYHPAPMWKKVIFASQMLSWVVGIVICLVVWIKNIVYFDLSAFFLISDFSISYYTQGNDLIDFLLMFECLLYGCLYLLGHFLQIHKSYAEKFILMPVVVFLLPIFIVFEALGTLLAVFNTDHKSFNLIEKQGTKVHVTSTTLTQSNHNNSIRNNKINVSKLSDEFKPLLNDSNYSNGVCDTIIDTNDVQDEYTAIK